MSDVTHLLEAIQHGDPKAAEELLPLVYEELRKLAAHKMSNESAGHTLQPTALVHEAWLRLGGGDGAQFQNRAHFFGAAAAMRRILVERARRPCGAGVAVMKSSPCRLMAIRIHCESSRPRTRRRRRRSG